MIPPPGLFVFLVLAHAAVVRYDREAVGLLTELDAFFTDRHHCGDLDAGVDGPVVWIACECGARMVRRADGSDAVALDG